MATDDADDAADGDDDDDDDDDGDDDDDDGDADDHDDHDDDHLIYTGHLAVPDHLQVVGVLQENLPQSENVELERFSHPDNEKVVFGISGDGLLKQLFCI